MTHTGLRFLSNRYSKDKSHPEPPMPETLTSTTLQLDPNTSVRLQQFAASTGRPVAEIASEALDRYLTRERNRAQLREDTLASWRHYQSTGLHLTGEEADEWLARLENGELVDPPPCHT